MNLRVLLILLISLGWFIGSIWWYHDQVICACSDKIEPSLAKVISVSKDSVTPSQKDSVTQHKNLTPDSTSSIMNEGKLIVYFPINSTKNDPNQETRKRLITLSRLILSNPKNANKKLSIIGFTDSLGKSLHNISLGLKRAERVKELFLKEGVPINRMEVASLGPSQPIATNDTPYGRAQNRRVEVIIH